MIALLIDIGNTRAKWRLAMIDAGDVDASGSPRWISAEQALPLIDIAGIGPALRDTPPATGSTIVETVFISNVASETVGGVVEDAAATIWRGAAIHRIESRAAQCGLVNAYRNPTQLGVDRWLAAIAARPFYPDRSILVCSFGTATTIDLIEPMAPPAVQATFAGGLILPGIDAMRSVLTTTTARLSASTGRMIDFADRTEDAITSGVMAAQIGAVERAIRQMRSRSVDAAPPGVCIVAGGAASHMAPLFAELGTQHRVIHDLVLRGLARVATEVAGSCIPAPLAAP